MKLVIQSDQIAWIELDEAVPESMVAGIRREWQRTFNDRLPTEPFMLFGKWVDIDDRRPKPKTTRRVGVRP